MKKAFDWLLRILGGVLIAAILLPVALGTLFFGVVVFGVNVLDWDLGPDADARAVAALENTGLTAYTIAAPCHAMTIDDSLTAFITFQYDNHEDNTDLRDGIMAAAADLPDWHVEDIPCDEYAARLNAILPEASFLLPSGVTFDAWYEDAQQLAFFDQDTGLMVYLQPDTQPHTGLITVDGLTVPHDGFVYEMETHGGFHGDGTTYQALIIPADKRAAFEEALALHADWQQGAVTRDEYVCMHTRMFYELPELLPETGITFDWWCYVDDYAREEPDEEPGKDVHPYFPAVMQEAGAVFSLNWHIALYDPDTGLFVYYESDA